MLMNVLRLGAAVLIVGFSLPQFIVADFSAGDAAAAVCTVKSGPKSCLTGGPVACTLNKGACSTGPKNCLSCQDGGGNAACTGDSNCAAQNHALRDMDCTAPKEAGDRPVVPAPPGD